MVMTERMVRYMEAIFGRVTEPTHIDIGHRLRRAIHSFSPRES